MKLLLNDLKNFVKGAVNIEEQDGFFRFCRFPEEQAQQYITALNNPDFYRKTKATAGVRLELKTDAGRISFNYKTERASSRSFCYFDLYVNGHLTASCGTEQAAEVCEGRFSAELPAGENQLCLYLPNLQNMMVTEVELAEATYAKAVSHGHTLLCYGDSITQGYDARHPSLSYVNQLADALDAEVYDKGIGGDKFNPALLEVDDGVRPDIVTVAYGTNDWCGHSAELFKANRTAFIKGLVQKYAGAKIFVILPIWRGDRSGQVTDNGTLEDARRAIRQTAEQYPNITVIDGKELVPHDPLFFVQDILHPNDLGMVCYAKHLAQEIKKHLS